MKVKKNDKRRARILQEELSKYSSGDGNAKNGDVNYFKEKLPLDFSKLPKKSPVTYHAQDTNSPYRKFDDGASLYGGRRESDVGGRGVDHTPQTARSPIHRR